MQTTNPHPAHQQVAGETNPRFWQLGEYGLVIDELLSFLKLALATERLPFELHHAGALKHASSNTVVIHDSFSLDYYFHVMPDLMGIVMPGYAYSPLLDLFRACFQQHRWLRYCLFHNPSAPLSTVSMLEAEVFNEFVQTLRTRARQQNTLLQMRKSKSETECYQTESIKKYVPKLLSGGGRTEPIRLDFQYQEGVFALADAMPYCHWGTDSGQWTYVPAHADWPSDNPESRARIDSRVAMQDRARFFRNIYRGPDSQIFQSLRGYISKMERGESGAYHFHCCFFLDATRPAHLTTDVLIEALSSRWSRVTQGRGFVFNCHEPSYQKKLRVEGRWALDPLASHNQHQVSRLTDYLVSYFARDKDQSIHVKPTAKSRALTMAIGRATPNGA